MKASLFAGLALLMGLVVVCGANSLNVIPAGNVHNQPQYQLQQQQQKKYLNTQPEFTQAWADYAHPPGYLPHAFKYVHPVQGIGYGYITWSGPINPQSFYAPVQLPYYYRIPPPSPNYNPAPPTHSMGQPLPVYKETRL